MRTATFTITMADEPGTPVTWREVTAEDGVVFEDITFSIPGEHVPSFSDGFLPVALDVADLAESRVDNLALEVAELAAVAASFPTGAQVDAEDELRSRLTAEGITHGNF